MNEINLANPEKDYYPGYALVNAHWGFPVVKANSAKGEKLVICGAGPSLEDAGHIVNRGNQQVWGCNSAISYLKEHGWRYTHGCAVDGSVRMLETWKEPVLTDYLLSTTIHPQLMRRLRDAGCNVTLFHSFIGFEGENTLYSALYPETICVGEGLNVVNRMLSVAEYMGFKKVWLCGADNALKGDVLHAGGNKLKDGRPFLRGEFDGRKWATTADMLVSAIDLARRKKLMGNKLVFVGDTLPKALAGKPDNFFERCIRWVDNAKIDKKEPGILNSGQGG